MSVQRMISHGRSYVVDGETFSCIETKEQDDSGKWRTVSIDMTRSDLLCACLGPLPICRCQQRRIDRFERQRLAAEAEYASWAAAPVEGSPT